MNEVQIVSLVALVGWLILATSGLRARNIGIKRGIIMAGLWAGIFAIVILFIDIVR